MWSIDRYVYYPLDDVNPSDPGIIDTSTWHDLIYVQKEISQPISRVADYTQLIRKHTEYRTHAIPKQSAVLGKFVLTMNRGPSGTFGWCMNIPYSRIEIVSPDAMYIGFYRKRADLPWMDTPYWEYFGWIDLWDIEPGSITKEVWGEQPLFPTVKGIYFATDGAYYHIFIEAEAFVDSNYYYQNFFHEREPIDDIEIEVYKDGEPISFEFWGSYSIHIKDPTFPAKYFLRTKAYANQILSTETILEYEFILNDDGSILSAPRLIDIDVKDLGLNNTLVKPVIIIEFTLLNDSAMRSLTFEYSVDGGVSWTQIPVTVVSPNKFGVTFTISGGEKYVSLRINATDINGLRSSTTVLNGLLVRGRLSLADFPKPFVSSELKASFIVGNTAPHGPLKWQAWTSDVLGAVGIAARLGLEATTGDVSQHIDTHVATYSSGVTTIHWNHITYKNVISIGGKFVNIFTYYYETYIPFKIIKIEKEVGIYSEITRKNYVRRGAWEDYAVIALVYDPSIDAYIMLVFGISGKGSLAASLVLQYFDKYRDLLGGNAIIIKWTDRDGDQIVELTDEITLVERW